MSDSCSGCESSPVPFVDGTLLLIPVTSVAEELVGIWMLTGTVWQCVEIATMNGIAQEGLHSYVDILSSSDY